MEMKTKEDEKGVSSQLLLEIIIYEREESCLFGTFIQFRSHKMFYGKCNFQFESKLITNLGRMKNKKEFHIKNYKK